MTDDEIVRCLQCGWPIKRTEPFAAVLGVPANVGAVHLVICAYDLAACEPPVTTQKRRAGMLGMN